MRIRIASIIPYNSTGGLHHETVVFDHELAERGIEHVALVPPGSGARHLRSNGVTVFDELAERPPRTIVGLASLTSRCSRKSVLGNLLAREDITHTRVFGYQNFGSLLVSRAAGCKTVLNVSSDYVRGTSLRLATRVCSPLVAGFLVTGDDLAISVAKDSSGKPVARYSPTQPSTSSTKIARQHNLDSSANSGVVTVGTVSKFTHQKDLTLFVNVCVEVSKTRSVAAMVVGAIEQQDQLNLVVKVATDAGWRVRFGPPGVLLKPNDLLITGRLSDAGTALEKMDVFLNTSRYEGLPGAILEAGLASIPVVAPEIGSIPSALQGWQGGFLSSRSTSELASCVSAAIDGGPYGPLGLPEYGTIASNYLDALSL